MLLLLLPWLVHCNDEMEMRLCDSLTHVTHMDTTHNTEMFRNKMFLKYNMFFVSFMHVVYYFYQEVLYKSNIDFITDTEFDK